VGKKLLPVYDYFYKRMHAQNHHTNNKRALNHRVPHVLFPHMFITKSSGPLLADTFISEIVNFFFRFLFRKGGLLPNIKPELEEPKQKINAH
jgi:hypothetical protein